MELNIPSDREDTYEPKAIPKYQNTCSDLESKIISMYAKGMTTRDIEGHLKNEDGFEEVLIASVD